MGLLNTTRTICSPFLLPFNVADGFHSADAGGIQPRDADRHARIGAKGGGGFPGHRNACAHFAQVRHSDHEVAFARLSPLTRAMSMTVPLMVAREKRFSRASFGLKELQFCQIRK